MSEHHHDHIGLQPGKRVQALALLAILVASVMIVMKGFAWLLTGSVALLGSFLDSIIDLSLSVMNFFAIRHAQTPADEEHRFGHGKAEALAALVQGAGAVFGGIVSGRGGGARHAHAQRAAGKHDRDYRHCRVDCADRRFGDGAAPCRQSDQFGRHSCR